MRVSKYTIYEIILFHIFAAAYALSFSRKDEWPVTILLFLLITALMVLEYLRTHLFVSPLFFWYAFWLGAISIGRMKLGIGVYPLYKDWSPALLRIVLLNTVLFFWLYWAGEWLSQRRGGFENDAITRRMSTERLSDVVILLLGIAIASFAVNVFRTGIIPQLTGNANAYRGAFVATRYYQIVGLLRCVLALVPAAVKNTSSAAKKACVVLLCAAYLLCEMLTGWRGYTLQAMILLLTSFFLTSDTRSAKTRRRNLLVVAAAFAAVAAFIIFITVTRDGAFESTATRVKYAIDTFYLYIAPNFLNFQSAVEKVAPKGYFMYTTEALWGIVMSPAENPQYIWNDVEYSIGAYNVCTYLLEPYCDAGLTGTLLWSAVIAFFSGTAFGNCVKRKSAAMMIGMGIANITIFMLHNNFFLRSSSFLIWLFIGIFVDLLTFRKRKTRNGKKILQAKYNI